MADRHGAGCGLGALLTLLLTLGGGLAKSCADIATSPASKRVGASARMAKGVTKNKDPSIIAKRNSNAVNKKGLNDLIKVNLELPHEGLGTAGSLNQQEVIRRELGSAWGSLPGEQIRLSRLTGVDPVKLAERVTAPKLITVAPTSEDEFINVFYESPSGSQIQDLRKLNRLIENGESAERMAGQTTDSKKALLRMIEERRSGRPIVILGHSENQGRVLVLPDGQKINVGAIHRRCLNSGTICLVLTCNSSDFAIEGKVSALEAYRMWQDGLDAYRLAEGDTVNMDDFVRIMRESRRRRTTRRLLTTSIAATGAVTGTVYVVETLQSQ